MKLNGKVAIATVLLSYMSAKNEKSAIMEDLIKLYKNKGTKIILEELLLSIKENVCLE